MIKPVSYTTEEKEKLRCAFTGMKEAGLSDYISESVELSQKLSQAIRDNSEVTVMTIDQHPEIAALYDAQAEIGTAEQRDKVEVINEDCDVISMVMDKMQESGVQDAMMSINQQ